MMTARQAAGMEAKGATLRDVVDDVLADPAAEDSLACEGAVLDLADERAELERA